MMILIKYVLFCIGLILFFLFIASLLTVVNDLLDKPRKKRDAARRAEREKRRKIEEYRQHQSDLRETANGLISTTRSLCQEVATKAWEADQALDKARQLFSERAFAPYWDSIELAANNLARIDQAVREISDSGERFIEVARQLDSSPPVFSIEVPSAVDVPGLAEKLYDVVAPAQRDFEFSTIFEQRKTNKLLVSGFGTLAVAIAEMGVRLSRTLGDLDKVLGRMRRGSP